MVLYCLRGMYVLLTAAIAAFYLLNFQKDSQTDFARIALMLLLTIALSSGVIFVDAMLRRKNLSAVSGVFLGLIAGLLAAYALSFVVDLFSLLTQPQVTAAPPQISPTSLDFLALTDKAKEVVRHQQEEYLAQTGKLESFKNILSGVKVLIGLCCVYVATSLVLQTKDDFRFVIPYIEFNRQIRGPRPVLLDTSALVDGRIADILSSNIFHGALIVPRFVVDGLQKLAESPDKLRRARGRRGLDILRKMQENPQWDIRLQDSAHSEDPEEQQLLTMARELEARVMTSDLNLVKVAEINRVSTINLNQLALALKPAVLPGEPLEVALIRPGEGGGQAVGYLDDGTMVVAENARAQIGSRVRLIVTSSIQTSAGRMVFGRPEEKA